MALYNTVHFLEFVMDLGTVKKTLVACLVGRLVAMITTSLDNWLD